MTLHLIKQALERLYDLCECGRWRTCRLLHQEDIDQQLLLFENFCEKQHYKHLKDEEVDTFVLDTAKSLRDGIRTIFDRLPLYHESSARVEFALSFSAKHQYPDYQEKIAEVRINAERKVLANSVYKRLCEAYGPRTT